MKKSLSLLALGALILTGCSSDDAPNAQVDPTDQTTGNNTYMTVNLKDAASLSRATDGGYEEGTGDETIPTANEITTANFYFYDANGLFVTQASVWDGGTADAANKDNIEFNGSTVIVLRNLTDKNFPKYLVTVLNAPSGIKPAGTLDDMKKVLTNTSTPYKNGDQFIMSTTSFPGQTDVNSASLPYFVTEIKESDFFTQAQMDASPSTAPTPVSVYIERLASRVKPEVSSTFSGDATKVGEFAKISDNTFKVKMTVAGADNAASIDMTTVGAEYVYVKFNGYALNATAKNSYVMKLIDEGWTTNGIGTSMSTWAGASTSSENTAWYNGTDHRSFWAKSWSYGQTGSDYFNYVTYGQLLGTNTTAGTTTAVGSNSYCAENTQDESTMNSNFTETVTSVLIRATVYSDESCTQPLDGILYNGLYFKKEHFINYVLSILNKDNKLNYYTEVEVTTNTPSSGDTGEVVIDGVTYKVIKKDEKWYRYLQLTADAFKITPTAATNDAQNVVEVTFTPAEDVTYYKKEGESFSAIEDADFPTALNTALAAITTSVPAEAYTNGEMYYNIPIQHLNNPVLAGTTTYNPAAKVEGQYGVVRNHSYNLSITSIKNFGTGIYIPDGGFTNENDEEIIPVDDPTEENNRYQVAATIKVLSWKIVSQSVNL